MVKPNNSSKTTVTTTVEVESQALSSVPVAMEPYEGFIKQCMFNRYLIFYAAAVLHFIWGAYILYRNEPFHIPPLEHIFIIIPSYHFIAWMFIGAALLAISTLSKTFRKPFYKVMCLSPQQTLLIWTALEAIFSHKLFQDLPLVIMAVCHTFALLYNFVVIPIRFNRKR